MQASATKFQRIINNKQFKKHEPLPIVSESRNKDAKYMLIIKNKTKQKSRIRVFTSLCIVFGEKVVHVESLLSCVVIWFHFE